MLKAPAVLAIMSSNTISYSFVWIIIAASTAGVGIFLYVRIRNSPELDKLVVCNLEILHVSAEDVGDYRHEL